MHTQIPGGLLHSELDKLKCPSHLTLQLESPEANSFYAVHTCPSHIPSFNFSESGIGPDEVESLWQTSSVALLAVQGLRKQKKQEFQTIISYTASLITYSQKQKGKEHSREERKIKKAYNIHWPLLR